MLKIVEDSKNIILVFMIFLGLYFLYSFNQSIIQPVVCKIVTCESDLKQKIIEKDNIIKNLKDAIEENEKTHKKEIDNLKENIESLKQLLDDKKELENKNKDTKDWIIEESKKVKVTKKKPTEQVTDLVLSKSVQPVEPLKPDILIAGIWNYYCFEEPSCG